MSIYDAFGACGPAVGCAPAAAPGFVPGYAAPGGWPLGPYTQFDIMGGAGGYGPMGPVQWDITGQVTTPPAEPSLGDKVTTFLNNETFGIKNRNLALGAVALGGITAAYYAGWFGKRKK